ncbi:hypothetical protein AVEN_65069-1 [Araneus ventricosus]|uniref:Uncharacterized protein n=1 Tax=Araneus ventricosus TaxID=182803 RepID=A0A4Y2MFH8_ARAVE|nr:hypothetical protein AVEN_65069-1 [Araneus ventricosus]
MFILPALLFKSTSPVRATPVSFIVPINPVLPHDGGQLSPPLVLTGLAPFLGWLGPMRANDHLYIMVSCWTLIEISFAGSIDSPADL